MRTAIAIWLIGLAGCGPSTEINPTVTRLTADPLGFDFGILELGEEVSETVALHAEGGEVFVEHVTAYGIGLTLSDGLEGTFIDEGLPATIDFTIQPGDYGLYEACGAKGGIAHEARLQLLYAPEARLHLCSAETLDII